MKHTFKSQQEAHKRGLMYERYVSEIGNETTLDSTTNKLQRTLIRFNSLLFGQTNDIKNRKNDLQSLVQSTPAAKKPQ